MPENNINKTGGGGARRLIFTGNVKTTLFNKYTPGSGVGALNRSVRRALVRKAAEPNCKGFCSNVLRTAFKTTLFNKYTPGGGGSGVGALNRSVRRALVRKAAEPNCKGFCSNVNGQLIWSNMGRYAY